MEEIKLDVKTLDTPNLTVSEKSDSGTIKISGVPENVSKKSVNFGPGLDLLMNPNKSKSRPNSPTSEINLSDISNLDKDLNKNLKSPREMRDKVFSAGFTAPPPTPELSATNNLKMDEPIKLKLSEPEGSKLGQSSNNLEGKDSTWDGMKKFNNIPVDPNLNVPEKPKMTSEQLLKEKFIYLRKLEALEKQGVTLSKKYGMESSLEEMKGEFEMIKAEKEKKSSCKFQGKMLMAFVSGLEFLNQKFDPFDLKLDGWAESVHENVEDYDDVFGELHEKYGGKTKMAPELKLLFMLGGSGFMLHMTNTMFKSSVPGMDDIMRQNPELMQQFTQAAVSSMGQNNPGFGNFMSGVMGGGPMGGAPMGGRGGAPPMPVPPRVASNMPRSRPDVNVARGNPVKRPEMKGPSGDVNSLLAGLKTKNVNIKQKDSSSTVSISELKEMNLGIDQPKKSRRKKSERNTVSLQL